MRAREELTVFFLLQTYLDTTAGQSYYWAFPADMLIDLLLTINTRQYIHELCKESKWSNKNVKWLLFISVTWLAHSKTFCLNLLQLSLWSHCSNDDFLHFSEFLTKKRSECLLHHLLQCQQLHSTTMSLFTLVYEYQQSVEHFCNNGSF